MVHNKEEAGHGSNGGDDREGQQAPTVSRSGQGEDAQDKPYPKGDSKTLKRIAGGRGTREGSGRWYAGYLAHS
jgi:hypothetical protein